VVIRVIRLSATDAAKARVRASANAETLNRGQVVALLELLREAIVRRRILEVDATLHGLCEGQGVNPAGIRWAAERLAAELVKPGT